MSRWKPLFAGLLPVVLLLLSPSTAEAHLVLDGAGEVASGALHPFVSPAHVLIFLGLGLLLGQQIPLNLKLPFRIFGPLSAAALLLTMSGWVREVYPPVLIAGAMAIALLVVIEKKLDPWVQVAICAGAAMLIGLDSGAEGGSHFAVLKTLAGTWLSLNATVFYIAACASNAAGKEWARTAIRIAGSWIIAISLLVLAFHFRR